MARLPYALVALGLAYWRTSWMRWARRQALGDGVVDSMLSIACVELLLAATADDHRLAACVAPETKKRVLTCTFFVTSDASGRATLSDIALKYDESIGCEWPPTAFEVHSARVWGRPLVIRDSLVVLLRALKDDGSIDIFRHCRSEVPTTNAALARCLHSLRVQARGV